VDVLERRFPDLMLRTEDETDIELLKLKSGSEAEPLKTDV